MPAPSLSYLAKKACIANIRHIDDVGELPYSLARAILLKVESPQQLRNIEKNSPQILGLDAEIWQLFIKRDIPGWESKALEPKNPHNWWKVYRKLRREADEEVKGHEAALKAALNERQTEKESHRITIVNKVMIPKKPRPKAPTLSRGADSSVLSFRSGSRTKTNTGKGLINRVRREARDASLLSAGRGVLATPTHLLASKRISENQSSAARTLPLKPPKSPQQPVNRADAKTRAESSGSLEHLRKAGAKRLPPSIFMPPKKRIAR